METEFDDGTVDDDTGICPTCGELIGACDCPECGPTPEHIDYICDTRLAEPFAGILADFQRNSMPRPE